MNELERLREIMARLRAPDGCPWDREQTHGSLTRYLIEEACELIDTIDRGDVAHMREELGDVLLQVFFHARIAEEAGAFDIEDVARGIADKLVRRHPHVFGDETGSLADADAVVRRWEELKVAEKAAAPAGLRDIPPALPALLYAAAVERKAVQRGHAAELGLEEEEVRKAAEGLTPEAAGRRLMVLVAACRRAGIDPEGALRREARGVVERAGPGEH